MIRIFAIALALLLMPVVAEEISIPIVESPGMNDIARASFGPDGRPRIEINPQPWARASAGFRAFALEHEKAHHELGHVVRGVTSGGFLSSNERYAQEVAADSQAAYRLASSGEITALRQAANEIVRFPPRIGYPLPVWRARQIIELADAAEHHELQWVRSCRPQPLEDVHLITANIDKPEGTSKTYEFSLRFRNTGDNAVECRVKVLVGYYSSDGNWDGKDDQKFKFRMRPGEEKLIEGTFDIPKKENYEVAVRFPSPRKDAQLISAKYIDDDSLGLDVILPKIITESEHAFVGLVKGNDLSYDPAEHKKYDSKIYLSGASRCRISLDRTSSLWRADFQCYSKPALSMFKDFARQVQSALGTGWSREDSYDDEMKWHHATFENGDKTVSVYYEVRDGSRRLFVNGACPSPEIFPNALTPFIESDSDKLKEAVSTIVKDLPNRLVNIKGNKIKDKGYTEMFGDATHYESKVLFPGSSNVKVVENATSRGFIACSDTETSEKRAKEGLDRFADRIAQALGPEWSRKQYRKTNGWAGKFFNPLSGWGDHFQHPSNEVGQFWWFSVDLKGSLTPEYHLEFTTGTNR
ncbi:MAG TPA: hypothetical protein VGP72_06470 [Planctomycetota bacterium]